MRLRLMMMYIFTGTPIIGVIALMGMMPGGKLTLIMAHESPTIAPVRAVAGISTE